ncbi:hypothetical protein [Terrisporobacter sp.]
MKVTFCGVEFTEVTFEAVNGEVLRGIMIHDLKDLYGDGDGVGAVDCDLPENADDAEALLSNEFFDSDYKIMETVKVIN